MHYPQKWQVRVYMYTPYTYQTYSYIEIASNCFVAGVIAGAVRRWFCPASMQLTRSSLTFIASSPTYLPLTPIEGYGKGDRMRWGTHLTVTPVLKNCSSLWKKRHAFVKIVCAIVIRWQTIQTYVRLGMFHHSWFFIFFTFFHKPPAFEITHTPCTSKITKTAIVFQKWWYMYMYLYNY